MDQHDFKIMLLLSPFFLETKLKVDMAYNLTRKVLIAVNMLLWPTEFKTMICSDFAISCSDGSYGLCKRQKNEDMRFVEIKRYRGRWQWRWKAKSKSDDPFGGPTIGE